MNKTAFSVLKYLAFNTMVAGTVTMATVFKIDAILTVASWFFGIEAALYLIAVLGSGNESFWEGLMKKKESLAVWKIIVEPLWIIYMFQLGHVFNGVCMAFTASAYLYLVVCKYQRLSEVSDQKPEEGR